MEGSQLFFFLSNEHGDPFKIAVLIFFFHKLLQASGICES